MTTFGDDVAYELYIWYWAILGELEIYKWSILSNYELQGKDPPKLPKEKSFSDDPEKEIKWL